MQDETLFRDVLLISMLASLLSAVAFVAMVTF